MTLRKIHLLSDEPIHEDDPLERDGLGFSTYADILAGAALGTPDPLTIGVFGEWGTGKTSLMRMLTGRLGQQENVVTVWYNPWRYEQEQHPIVPLLATILRALESNNSVRQALGDKGNSLIAALRAIAYGFSGKAKIGIPSLAQVEAKFVAKDAIKREDQLISDPLIGKSLYYESFERLSRVDLEDVRIVIAVDDLDRCFPDKAIQLLESIKLVLSQPGFVFVLGLSRHVIEGYLEHRYEVQYGLADFEGRNYLDKIVQLPFFIPPHRGRMEAFSESLLNRLQPSDARALKPILPMIGVACGGNPRATVRFVNNLLIDKAINWTLAARGEMGEVPIAFCAITRSLQQRWPEAWSLLVTSDELCAAVAAWKPENLVTITGSEDRDQARLAQILIGDRQLRKLIFQHGKDWLEDSSARRSAVQFLQAERHEGYRRAEVEEPGVDVVVAYSEGNQVEAASVYEHLHLAGLQVEFRSLDPSRIPHWPDRPVAWVMASDTDLGDEGAPLPNTLKALGSRPVFFIVSSQFAQGAVLEQVPSDLLVRLGDGDVTGDDLRPLILALRRARLTRNLIAEDDSLQDKA